MLISHVYGALDKRDVPIHWDAVGDGGCDADDELYVSLMLAALLDGELLLHVALKPYKMFPGCRRSILYETLNTLIRVGHGSSSARRALTYAVEAGDHLLCRSVMWRLEDKGR